VTSDLFFFFALQYFGGSGSTDPFREMGTRRNSVESHYSGHAPRWIRRLWPWQRIRDSLQWARRVRASFSEEIWQNRELVERFRHQVE